jgi:hypothetical protein
MKALAAIILTSWAILTTAAPTKEASLAPDLVILNASIYTLDEVRPKLLR